MEKVLIKSRKDCPPQDTRQLIKEKDFIIKKQNEKIKLLESNLNLVLKERNILFNLFVKLINNNFDVSNSDFKLCSTKSLNSLLSNNSSTSSHYYSVFLSPNAANLSATNNAQSENVKLLDDNCLSFILQHMNNAK